MKVIPTASLSYTPNILRLIEICKEFLIIFPVIILIYQQKGITVGDFFLIQGIFCFIVFFLEIPTGYIADLFSRKKIIIFAMFSYLLSSIYLYFAQGILDIIIVEFLWGLSNSLLSGTQQAYLYDVLKKQNKEKNVIEIESSIRSYASYGCAISAVVGGGIYNYIGMEVLIVMHICITFLGFVLTLFLPDIIDVKRIVEQGKSKLNDIKDITKYTIKHPDILWLIIFPAAFCAGTLCLIYSIQPLMENNSVPVLLFGIFVGCNMFFHGVLVHITNNILKKYSIKKYSMGLLFMNIIAFSCGYTICQITNMPIIYVLLLVFTFVSAGGNSIRIVMTSLINHRIKSDERATVLSVDNMIKRAFQLVVLASCKFLIDGASLSTMYMVIGVVVTFTTFWAMKKTLKIELF